jgi:hypothetical protein
VHFQKGGSTYKGGRSAVASCVLLEETAKPCWKVVSLADGHTYLTPFLPKQRRLFSISNALCSETAFKFMERNRQFETRSDAELIML